jgi:hypothetical protein
MTQSGHRPTSPTANALILASSISCNSGLAGGYRMQFDQLKRREFITLIGGAVNRPDT